MNSCEERGIIFPLRKVERFPEAVLRCLGEQWGKKPDETIIPGQHDGSIKLPTSATLSNHQTSWLMSQDKYKNRTYSSRVQASCFEPVSLWGLKREDQLSLTIFFREKDKLSRYCDPSPCNLWDMFVSDSLILCLMVTQSLHRKVHIQCDASPFIKNTITKGEKIYLLDNPNETDYLRPSSRFDCQVVSVISLLAWPRHTPCLLRNISFISCDHKIELARPYFAFLSRPFHGRTVEPQYFKRRKPACGLLYSWCKAIICQIKKEDLLSSNWRELKEDILLGGVQVLLWKIIRLMTTTEKRTTNSFQSLSYRQVTKEFVRSFLSPSHLPEYNSFRSCASKPERTARLADNPSCSPPGWD